MNIAEIMERDMRDANQSGSADGAADLQNNDDGSYAVVGVYLAAAVAVLLFWASIGMLVRFAIKAGILAGGVSGR